MDRKKVAREIVNKIKDDLAEFHKQQPEGVSELDIVMDGITEYMPPEEQIIYEAVLSLKCMNYDCRVQRFKGLPAWSFNRCPMCLTPGVTSEGRRV